jgi:hypothetical protein
MIRNFIEDSIKSNWMKLASKPGVRHVRYFWKKFGLQQPESFYSLGLLGREGEEVVEKYMEEVWKGTRV